MITGVTRDFDCRSGVSGKTASQQIYESGAVVSAIVPKTAGQHMENGMMTWATRIGKIGGAPYMDIQTLANETGGEILKDKPEKLNTTFTALDRPLADAVSPWIYLDQQESGWGDAATEN